MALLITIFLLFVTIFSKPKWFRKRFTLQSGLVSNRRALKIFFQNKKQSTFNQQPTTNFLLPIAYCLLPIFLFSLSSNAQDTIKRPKIGLVLSGGGAKGFAHIGVLKVLEKAGVKIDYIGGTSMGAVIGGLYASGYNATQIDSIFAATNFDELLNDYIPRTSKSFYEKRNDELYAITLPVRKFSLGVPIALSKGLYNYNLLNQLTKNVRHINDFSKLPIPFFCIATNVETGKEVLLNKGYLPEAILASSAFPTLFSPVEIDGKMLVDGGVSNNYPIDEVRKMGADIIIGVDVQDDLKDRQALYDATRILVQITNLQMMGGMKEKIKKTDIYIKPDISDYGVISFNQGEEIIQKGEEAAEKLIDEIKKIGNTKNFKIQHLEKTSDSLYIKSININNNINYTNSYVMGKLGFRNGSKITYEDLKKGIDKLNATQNFFSINYRLLPLDNGDQLKIDLVETKIKTFLKMGLHYDELYKSAALVNFTKKKLFLKNDVLSADFGLGDNFRYNLDYYVDNGYYFSYGFKSYLNQFNRNVSTDFSNGALFSQYNINSLNIDFLDLTNQLYVQTIFAQKFLIGAGVEWKHLNINSKTVANSVFENSNYGSVFGSLIFDSFDNKYFPKKGVKFNGLFQSYLFSSDFSNQFNRFSMVKGDFSFAQRIFRKTTFKFDANIGLSIGQNNASFLDYAFGGYGFQPINNFYSFYGYDFLSVAGNSFIKTGGTFDIEIFKKNHLNFYANYAIVEDDLLRSVDWYERKKLSGYGLGYGLETLLGPIEFKYSWSPDNTKSFAWLSIGFWF